MIKPIAIYLPQYHPIPENDKAWGDGFTEWTNVRKAKPLFEGHYQPHIPHEDVGYYDLRDPEVMVRQAAMAKAYGIYGFAFYHYWFNGKRLLETPLDNMLKSGTPDFPFLYIWANEHWSKRWDGSDHEIIQEQHYSHEDDLNHIRFLCENVFSHKRYITIDDKPVFHVYRTELFPDIKETARIWREEAKKFGFKDLYLVRVENFVAGINPLDIGFDAAMEFAPDRGSVNPIYSTTIDNRVQAAQDYKSTVINTMCKTITPFSYFRSVFPTWDNTPRRSGSATLYKNVSIEYFKYYFINAIAYTESHQKDDSQFVFINAWNEWGEGCHIEPDIMNGYLYLSTIKDILEMSSSERSNQLIQFYQTQYKYCDKNLTESINNLDKLTMELFYIKNSYIYRILLLIRKLYRKFSFK